MSASEADDLGIFEVWIFGRYNGRRNHARMVVVDDVEPALRQVDVSNARYGIGDEDWYALLDEHIGKVMVHQFVIVIWPRCEDDRIRAVAAHLLDDFPASGYQLIAESL